MGGIAGIVDLVGDARPTRAELAAMLQPMQSRGPAGQALQLDQEVGLAQALLREPRKVLGTEARNSVKVVCSGEIYNQQELLQQLRAKGHPPIEAGDLAALLAGLYHAYGDAFVHRLNGQFAIAVWDVLKRRLLLLRDRVGIAPLHYALQDGRLLFASEVKGLLSLFTQAPELDPIALDQLFTFWSARAPRSMFRGVQQLPPGEMLIVESGRLRRGKYWEWGFPTSQADYASAPPQQLAEELRALLADAVQLRLQTSEPAGAYLSGGLDSSILAALFKQLQGAPPRTFSLGFEDAALDESNYQRRMADFLGSQHSLVTCRQVDIATQLPDAVWHAETPMLRTAPVPMSLLSEQVQQAGYGAVLTGEGADEVFGGYDIFKEAAIRQFWARQPKSRLRPLLLQRLYPYLQLQQQSLTYLRSFFGRDLDQASQPCFSHLLRWSTTAMCKQFFSSQLKGSLQQDAIELLEEELPLAMPRWAPLKRAQYLEMTTLLPGYLLSTQGERMLMANSVLGRFPFLDHRVIEFAARLPPHLKLNVLNEKYLLKQAMGDLLPAEILKRYKQPYRAPDIAAFFPGPPPDYVMDLLSAEALRRTAYFCPQKVGRLVEKVRIGRAVGAKDNMAFVGILSTQLWHHVFVDGHRAAGRRLQNQNLVEQYSVAGV